VKPVALLTHRLLLDVPTLGDAGAIAEYCQDPLFETALTIPWPYRLADAEHFVGELVPSWWANDSEYTWALRRSGALIGVVGFRTSGRDIGFWLGAPHRGRGYMPEAVRAVLDWVFARSDGDVEWETLIGNHSSAAVARKTGFTFRGEGTITVANRDGSHPTGWKGSISKSDSREPKPGWPARDA
jgi:RimJ/RimL family protein N-acetyltransferase